MKRIVVLAAALSMLISMTCAAGTLSDVDFSTYTTEELLAFRDAVMEEINNRVTLVNDVIGTGTFLVGRDIKEGIFHLTNENDGVVAVKIYADQASYDEGETCSWENPREGVVCTVNLKDGMILELVNFTGTIVEAAAPSWAP